MKDKNKLLKIKKKVLKSLLKIILFFSTIEFDKAVEEVVYADVLNEYNYVLDDLSNYLKENNITDVVSINNFFNTALWNGYLSNNHEFYYNLDRKLFIHNPGLSCILGSSVCLNNAFFLKDLYKKMGYNSYVINCYVGDDIGAYPICNDVDIVRNINSSSNDNNINSDITNIMQLIVGNHSITAVESNSEVYYFDPTNLIYLKQSNPYTVEIINGIGKFDLKYNIQFLFFGQQILKSLININSDEYANQILSQKKEDIDYDKLEDFYNRNQERYEKINNSSIINYPDLIFVISMSVSYLIISNIFNKIVKVANKKIIDDYEQLITEIKNFITEHSITEPENIVKELYYMLDKEYLLFNEDAKDISKHIFERYPQMQSIVNNKKFRNELINQILNELDCSSSLLFAKFINSNDNKTLKKLKLIGFYKDDNIVMYDANSNKYLIRKSKNIIVSEDGSDEYKINLLSQILLKCFPPISIEHNNEQQISDDEWNKFIKRNKELIKDIHKRY